MFGSTNPFGQSSSSPFASQPGFGQTSSTNNNPFAPKPFGSTTPFGSQTGGSLFGGTSTGVFGAAQSSSPFSSATTFGATSTPAFGSSTPAFGSSSTPTFGSSSSSFGGSLVFGQKPAFGGFGSTPTQSSPFGSTTQQSQPAFGTSIFGQTSPFGSSQPAFSGTTAPAFGGVTTPAFGTGSTPAFGSSTTSAFGPTSAAAFAFGSSSAFGSSATSAFGTQSASPFGAQSASAFAPSSTPSFSFGTTPAFGQTTSAFGSSPFGSTAFAAQSSPFGAQSSASPFGSPSVGQSPFGGQRGGSRVAPYTPTTDTDGGSTTQPPGKLESISAMPIYKDKSHEELRWEDYQSGDKGGPQPAAPSSGGITFGAPTAQSGPFASSSAFAHTSANPFSATTPPNPFMSKPPGISNTGFATSTTPSSPFASGPSNPFAAPQSNPFGSTSTTVTSIFNSAPSPSSSLFNTSTTAPFASSSSLFSSGPAPSTFNTGLGFSSSQTSSLFSTTTPNPQTSPGFGHSTSSFGQVTAPAFSQSNMFSTSLFQGSLSLAPSSSSGAFIQSAPSFGTPFQQPQPSQTFSISSFGLPQQGGTSSLIGQGNFGSLSATQGAPVMQPLAVTNPFGNLPAMPQISIGRAGTAPSVQYGISSMPVIEKPAPVRISPLLTSRHLSHRRIRLPARKYWPNTDSPKVPFFTDDEETPSTPKADAVFIPRENPRSLVIHPMEHWPSRTSAERTSSLKETSTPSHVNGTPKENGVNKEKVNASQKPNGVEDEHPVQEDSYRTLSGHRAGEAAIVYEHGADIEALMPKLRRSDYYTEPRIQELAAKERAEPGYCRHVKDFVVGRHGYGSIKFLGETDVRGLDLESLVQFNNREVIVYVDDTKKPPVGQGLNKPAEVTLLNIKCFDKKTGRQYTEGPKVEKYKEMLKRKVEDQEAEFVSFDPIKGEWKFRVRHFSAYRLLDDGDVEGEDGNDDKDEDVSEIGA